MEDEEPDLYVVGTGADITERRRAQQALRESEAEYRMLFEQMLDGFALHEIICDEAGRPCDYRFLEINPTFERLTGLQRDEVVVFRGAARMGETLDEALRAAVTAWSGEDATADQAPVVPDVDEEPADEDFDTGE